MEQTGRILNITAEETINNGGKKQTILIDTTQRDYKSILAVVFVGKMHQRLIDANVRVGEVVKLKFDVQSREYQGKYFTEAKGFGIEKI